MQTLFEYSEFITASNTSIPSTLTNETNGFTSFLRLVGCVYFKKHKSAFLPSFPTPVTLFNSVQADSNHQKQHKQWLDLIQDRIWIRTQFEEDMVPSSDALLRHWKRSCCFGSMESSYSQQHRLPTSWGLRLEEAWPEHTADRLGQWSKHLKNQTTGSTDSKRVWL